MLRTTLVCLLAMVSTSGICNDPPPEKMTKIIAQYTGPGIAPQSFAAKPKTFFRAGHSFCRTEEEPDPVQNLHLVTVMNEPDAWLIDLANNRAKHMIDPGPTFNCRLPIFAFSQAMATGAIGKLEFGHELEFFKSQGAVLKDGPVLHFKALYYELKTDEATFELVLREDIQAPIMVALIQGDKLITVKYALWNNQVPFDAALFSKPAATSSMEEPK